MVCNCCGCTLIRSSRYPLLTLSLFSLFFNWSLNRSFADVVSTQFGLQTPVSSVVARMSNHTTSTVIHLISLSWSFSLFFSLLFSSLSPASATCICVVLFCLFVACDFDFSHLGPYFVSFFFFISLIWLLSLPFSPHYLQTSMLTVMHRMKPPAKNTNRNRND